MKKTSRNFAFVSSSDHKYFPMLLEWVYAIRRFPQSASMDICILNAGLTEDQVKILQNHGCIVAEAQWPCPLPAAKTKNKEYLKSCLCRPFIPEYFPNYEGYIWMDADTWIQDWRAIEMFMAAAQDNKMALTAQSDRCYPRQIRLKWLGRLPIKLKGFYINNAKKAYGFKKAKELIPYSVLLAGMFAMEKDAPHWKRWQELMLQAVKKGRLFTAEQLSLGVLCYLEKFNIEILPAYLHWLCEYKPLWDEQRSVFVEPFFPHEVLGVLHLSGWDEMRLDRTQVTDFKTLQGTTVTHTYRYPFFDGALQKEIPYAA